MSASVPRLQLTTGTSPSTRLITPLDALRNSDQDNQAHRDLLVHPTNAQEQNGSGEDDEADLFPNLLKPRLVPSPAKSQSRLINSHLLRAHPTLISSPNLDPNLNPVNSYTHSPLNSKTNSPNLIPRSENSSSFGSPTLRPRLHLLEPPLDQNTIRAPFHAHPIHHQGSPPVSVPRSPGQSLVSVTVRPAQFLRLTPVQFGAQGEEVEEFRDVEGGLTEGGRAIMLPEQNDIYIDMNADIGSDPDIAGEGMDAELVGHDDREQAHTQLYRYNYTYLPYGAAGGTARGQIPHWDQGFQMTLPQSYQRMLDNLPKSSNEGSFVAPRLEYSPSDQDGDGLANSENGSCNAECVDQHLASLSGPFGPEGERVRAEARIGIHTGKVDEVDVELCFYCDRERNQVRGECILVEVEGWGRQWLCSDLQGGCGGRGEGQAGDVGGAPTAAAAADLGED